jgi:hypothetical protein
MIQGEGCGEKEGCRVLGDVIAKAAGSLRQHTSPGDIKTFPCQTPLNASISSLYYTLATVALAHDAVDSHTTHAELI